MALIDVKTRKQIADEYSISTKTLQRNLHKQLWWLESRCTLTPGYQKLIYDTMGWPSGIDATIYDSIPMPTPPEEDGGES